jgi:hypothetical protein
MDEPIGKAACNIYSHFLTLDNLWVEEQSPYECGRKVNGLDMTDELPHTVNSFS